MAKKSTLTISGGSKDDESKFRDSVKGYRLSTNVIDRRASQYRPSETPRTGSGGGVYGTQGMSKRDTSVPAETTPDDYGGNSAEFGPALKSGQTRKAEPQQAIDETFNRR